VRKHFETEAARLEEQWNRENVQGIELSTGNGRTEGAAGVKTAKLCVEQDQIGGHSPSA